MKKMKKLNFISNNVNTSSKTLRKLPLKIINNLEIKGTNIRFKPAINLSISSISIMKATGQPETIKASFQPIMKAPNIKEENLTRQKIKASAFLKNILG